MIYQKIKKEKRKCIFRTTREFICLNLFRPYSVFFPPKKILPYLCYVFPPLKNNISPFFSMSHFFFSSYIYCLKIPIHHFKAKNLRIRNCEYFFSRVDGLVQIRKKRKGENRKQKDNVI